MSEHDIGNNSATNKKNDSADVNLTARAREEKVREDEGRSFIRLIKGHDHRSVADGLNCIRSDKRFTEELSAVCHSNYIKKSPITKQG